MILPMRRTSILVVLALIWLARPSLGQSLSIIKKAESEFWITANAPADRRFVLQGSKDLNLWLDINDTVSGTVSNRVGAGVPDRYFRLVPWVEPKALTIVIVGDSTVADLASNSGWFNGWGQGMYGYFKPSAQVINLARPGYGTKNFLVSEDKTRMLAIKPDYVLVELALVDAFNGPPEVNTTLEEYRANLKTIVQLIRGFNGIPILLTAQAVRLYDQNDQIYPAYTDRNDVIKQVAAEQNVYLIDLNSLSVQRLNELGRTASNDLWSTTFTGEWLHFSTKGAEVIAGLVVGALPSSLGPYILTDKILVF